MTDPEAHEEGPFDLASVPKELRPFVEAIVDETDFPLKLAKLALSLRSKSEKACSALALEARRLAPLDTRVRTLTYWAVGKQLPAWHFRLIADEERNEIYARALQRSVTCESVVLEIGTGTGILAMLAARAGAAHVYTCENQPLVAELARRVIARNGLSDKITVISKELEALKLGRDLPSRADLLVSEIVDVNLLGERVLPLVSYAREHLLVESATILPRWLEVWGRLTADKGKAAKFRMKETRGFDLSIFDAFAPPNIPGGIEAGEYQHLSEARVLVRIDMLGEDLLHGGGRTIDIIPTHSGTCRGLTRWIGLDFGTGLRYENRPMTDSAWSPLIDIFPSDITVESGKKVTLHIEHDKSRVFFWPVED